MVGPVDLDLSDDELIQIIRSEQIPINKITRLFKYKNTASGKEEPSPTIKVDFEGTVMPSHIYLGNLSLRVRKYNQPPLRCYNCQLYGHLANGCTKKIVCNICSGEHSMKDCTDRSQKCANCELHHAASSRECRFNKEAKEIEKLKRESIPYEKARLSVSRSRAKDILKERGIGGTDNLNREVIYPDIHRSQGSYNPSPMSYARAVTNQKVLLPDHYTEIVKKLIDEAFSTMTRSLLSFLQEAFSMQLQKENTRERKLLLMSMTKNNFGLKVDESFLISG